VGYQNSSLKELIEYMSSSIKMDLFFFFMRISGLTILFAWLVSYGNLDLLGNLGKEFFKFNLLQTTNNLFIQVLIILQNCLLYHLNWPLDI
jgi:hypothetical protein